MADHFSLPPEVVDALRKGNKIEAIRRLREAAGLGLAEAKAAVDHHEGGGAAMPKPVLRPAAHHAPHVAPRRNGLSPGEQPRAGSNPMTVVAVIALAALAYWLFSRYG